MRTFAKDRQLEHPARQLPLWDVIGPIIVSTYGTYMKGFKIQGLDSEHLPAESLLQAAGALYRDLASHVPEQTVIQILLRSHSDYRDVLEKFANAPRPEDPILELQRQKRLEYLLNSNLRRHSLFLFCGKAEGLCRKEFVWVTERSHLARQKAAQETASYLTGILSGAGLRCSELQEEELLDLFWELLNPGRNRPPRVIRAEWPKELVEKETALKVRTLREYLVQSEMDRQREYLRVGESFSKVLTLCDLPEQTEFMDSELFYSLDFDFWLSVTVQVPSQSKYRAFLDQQRRFAKADAGRSGNIEDYKRTGKVREGEELARLLAETGQRLVLVACQAVIKAESPAELAAKTRTFTERARTKGFLFFEERAAHDREFFKTLPGLSVATERHLLLTSNNAVDLLPLSQEDHGDRDPVFLVKTRRGELFSFNPFEKARDNWNATIFGASGSGKSVFCNLLIATSILSNATRGRLIVVDFAGETKSSYLMLAKMFGGEFVPVLSDKHALNPFPPPERALDAEGCLKGGVETFLSVLTDILLTNTGQGKEDQLYRHILQRALRDTYRRSGNQAPIYSDLLETLRSFRGERDIDQGRLKVVLDLLSGFLESPAARLFNRRSTATPQTPFLILDLYGLESLEPNVAEAVTFLTTQWVKELAFDASDPGYKYIILDEVAQLIRRQEMVALLDELYSTARKHRTSVWTVTQSYQTYRQSSLVNTIKLNSTTQIFLSHASDEAGRKQIAEDYQFTRREKHLFDGLRTVKGKFSEALIRTECGSEDGSEKRPVTSVLRVELSPLDYQICTSDAADRELQRRYIESNPGKTLCEILYHIAYRRRG